MKKNYCMEAKTFFINASTRLKLETVRWIFLCY